MFTVSSANLFETYDFPLIFLKVVLHTPSTLRLGLSSMHSVLNGRQTLVQVKENQLSLDQCLADYMMNQMLQGKRIMKKQSKRSVKN